MAPAEWIPGTVDVGRPSTARMYDYVLGGGHNLAADRALVDKLLEIMPEMRRFAIMNRAFLRRAVLFMVARGIRQFLDLGSGIPTVGNVHEIAQQADPACRVLYVDIEAVAVAHSELLLVDNPNATILQADVTEPETVLGSAVTRRMLDFGRPVGILAVTIGHHISPEQDPVGVFAEYRDAVVPGSHLAITHSTNDFATERSEAAAELTQKAQINVYPRTKAEVYALFGDFELVAPGLVTTSQWRPERETDVVDPAQDGLYAGVARKTG